MKQDLLGLADFAFRRLRARLEGLSDEEYLWEPAPGCWNVRRDEAGVGRGDWQAQPWPAPFTTIAWRLGHIINNLFDRRYALQLDLEPLSAAPAFLPLTAAEALGLLEEGYAVTRGYLTALPEEDLVASLGDVAGPWAGDHKAGFVLHMLDELIHHAAEVGVLRDLYRAQAPVNPAIDALLAGDPRALAEALAACPDGLDRARSERPDLLLQAAAERRWVAVPLLVESGFPLSLADGRSALHYAAAGGSTDTIELLVRTGADLTLTDAVFRSTPAEWADYFGQPAAAEQLRRLSGPADSDTAS